jgi:imidazolonepropionase-like amidohydrolase
VSAHVETNVDFHYAIEIGVDEISHLPGYYIHTIDAQTIAPISEDDARRVKEKGIDVVTTTVLSKSVLRDMSLLPTVQVYQRRNLLLLKKWGVRTLIGTDHSETSIEELFYLRGLQVFTNLELLRMISLDTPRAMFPGRNIGAFEDGYEASFLVLEGDPVRDLDQVRRINLRVKQGQVLATK